MKILFLHQNFPGQFIHLAPALVRQGHQVTAILLDRNGSDLQMDGVKIVPYTLTRGTAKTIHPWVGDFETKVIRAEGVYKAALKMRGEGYVPDLVISHHGWGESLFVKEVWPATKLALYCEFYYHRGGTDVQFDPEFPPQDGGDSCRVFLKNANHLLHMEIADAGICPTQWQANTFPERFRDKIAVIHDGIRTDIAAPAPDISMSINKSLSLSRDDEVITFVNRNLEPYRGYHIFMRALPELLRRRPKARVLIVGGSEVSYGAKPKAGSSWRQIFIDEVKPLVGEDNWQRVHFLGKLPYKTFLGLLRLSTVHVYLTYPFVLSWSLLEAMSTGCAIVASDTGPVTEVIDHGETGRLVNFFDSSALTDEVCQLLDDPQQRQRLGANARQFVVDNYDLKTVCLPRQLAWVAGVMEQA